MIQYAKLNIPVNIAAIREEVLALTDNWTPHFNTVHYSGEWSVLSLRSPEGKADQIIPELLAHNYYQNTLLMDQCPAIRETLGNFQCELMAVRLMNLKSGSIIKEHRDVDLCFEKGEARLHLPVFTHSGVRFYSKDQLLCMYAGECWYVNVNLPHSVTNEGPSDRIHLVIDCRVNDWLSDLFARSECRRIEEEDRSELTKKIIRELRLQNTEKGNQLANELEAGLVLPS